MPVLAESPPLPPGSVHVRFEMCIGHTFSPQSLPFNHFPRTSCPFEDLLELLLTGLEIVTICEFEDLLECAVLLLAKQNLMSSQQALLPPYRLHTLSESACQRRAILPPPSLGISKTSSDEKTSWAKAGKERAKEKSRNIGISRQALVRKTETP